MSSPIFKLWIEYMNKIGCSALVSEGVDVVSNVICSNRYRMVYFEGTDKYTKILFILHNIIELRIIDILGNPSRGSKVRETELHANLKQLTKHCTDRRPKYTA